MIKFVVLSLACIAVASALPFLVHDEEGQQYYLEPVVDRHRRDLQFANNGGAGGATKLGQGGAVNFNNRAGLSGSHQRIPGVGHVVSGDFRAPIWSNKNKYGESTINVGGGASQYLGRYGNQNLDKRVGLNFNHRF